MDGTLDYVVIGAGPAGLQVAQQLPHGCTYVLLERGAAPGQFFTTFPRHRTMISNNKVHTGSNDPEFNLRMDWNSLLSDDPELRFTRYSQRYFPPADDYVRYLGDFARRHKLDIRYDSRVVRVSRGDAGFVVTDQHGNAYAARRLVVATGASLPYIPPIPGIEAAETYATVSVDPQEFVNQRVLILGKGNSALETADNLIETAAVIHVVGPHPLRLAWQTHYVGHLRAVNNNFLDTYQLKSQNALLDAAVEEITRDDDGYIVRLAFSRSTVERRYDRVIVCTGFRFDASMFDDDCRPRLTLNDRFPELTPAYESANIDGLYFGGTLTQPLDFKRSTNGFIHGFRYGARALCRLLDQRHHSTPWPHRELPPEPSHIAHAVVERINRSSALWQQYGVLADVLVVPPAGPARYYEEVPTGLLGDPDFRYDGTSFAITLEYGAGHDGFDPFTTPARAVQRASHEPYVDVYLHPVVRRHEDGRVVATHHMEGDLESRWLDPGLHVAPLTAFLAGGLPRLSESLA